MTQTVPDISPLMPMHQDPLLVIENCSAFLAFCFCEGNSSVIKGFPSQRNRNAKLLCILSYTSARVVEQTVAVTSQIYLYVLHSFSPHLIGNIYRKIHSPTYTNRIFRVHRFPYLMTTFNSQWVGNVHTQRCGHWCPDAKAPGQQYPEL